MIATIWLFGHEICKRKLLDAKLITSVATGIDLARNTWLHRHFFQEENAMSTDEFVNGQRHATETMLIDPEVPNNPGSIDAPGCECGFPELYCNRYCSIEDCDWMVY